MRYALAIIISVFLIALMFGFMRFMDMKLMGWRNTDAEVSSSMMLGVQAAYLIHSYWYIIIFPLIVIPLATAVATSARKRDE
jgi:hypothetical protein